MLAIHDALLAAFGPQSWWPAETPFEVMVGAILTQNTNWRNVERAIANLRAARALTPGAMARLRPAALAELIRPAGYFRVKAARLGHLLAHLRRRHGGSVARLLRVPGPSLREELLGITGIGPETADSILLYAAGRPSFVVDAYTRRVLSRHGLVGEGAAYADIQRLFTGALPADVALFNEYHALIVRLGKEFCRPRAPRCAACPLGAAPRPAGGRGSDGRRRSPSLAFSAVRR
ncbi:MAG TPA: endonuclease III domain-containing protein [bacterium]